MSNCFVDSIKSQFIKSHTLCIHLSLSEKHYMLFMIDIFSLYTWLTSVTIWKFRILEHQWFLVLYYFCSNTSSWWVYTWFHTLNVISDFLYSPEFVWVGLHVSCDQLIFSLSMTHECHHMEISYFRNTRFLYLEIMGYFLWVRDTSVFLPFDLLNSDKYF